MTIGQVFVGTGFALLLASIAASISGSSRPPAVALITAGNLAIAIGALAERDWIWATTSVALAALTGWDWWHRNRRKSARATGAKARARLAALVRALRESLRPRPALRPVPEGVA